MRDAEREGRGGSTGMGWDGFGGGLLLLFVVDFKFERTVSVPGRVQGHEPFDVCFVLVSLLSATSSVVRV